MAGTFTLAGRFTLPDGSGNANAKFLVRIRYQALVSTAVTMTEDIPVTTAADGTYSATIVRSDEATYEARPRRGITFARPFYFPAPPADLGTVHIMDLFREYSQWVPSLVLPVPGGGSGTGGTTDHGALTGLLDDDHPQYLTRTDAATTFATKAAVAALDNSLVWSQVIPAATWTINNPLGRRANPAVFLMDGEEVDTDTHVDDQYVVVTFPVPTAGFLVLT